MGLDFDSLSFQTPTSNQGGAGQNAGLAYGNPYSGKRTWPFQLEGPCLHPFPPLNFFLSEMLIKTSLIVQACWAEAEDSIERLPGEKC